MYKPCLKLINILDRKSNNLGLFKLLLAVLIVWNHSFALASVGGKPHLILGNYTVALFGFISGLLVSNSLIKNDSLARFVVRSGLRLYIPFSIAVIAGALLVAPIISNFGDLSVKDLWIYIRNCLTFNIQFNIPNVLVGHRNPHGINGSLWCMPLFFFMYALVASIYSIDQLKRNGIGSKVFFLFVILLAADPFNLLSCGVFPRILTIDFPSIALGFGFCLGVLFRCYADSISLNFRVCVSLLIAAWLFSGSSLSPYINILAFGYCIVCLSVERHVQELRPKLEISLGIFLYSFPIQQLFSYKFPGQGPYLNFICSIFTTMVVAIVSALWLEKWLDKLANEVYSKVLNICKI